MMFGFLSRVPAVRPRALYRSKVPGLGANAMRKLFHVAACVLLACVFLAPKGRDAFEGKWDVTLTPDSGGKERKDTLTFAGDKLTSEFLKKEGYKEATYEADV